MTDTIVDYNSIDRELLQQVQIKMTEKVVKSKKKYSKKERKKNKINENTYIGLFKTTIN